MTWVAMIVAGRISRPIHAMAEAAQKVADGDYTPQVEVTIHDEIGLGNSTRELREGFGVRS